MEKLTLQQLAVYLPYKLKGNFEVSEVVPEAKYELREKELRIDNVDFFLKYATPILYPISCLTNEITHKGETFVPVVELAKTWYKDYDAESFDEFNITDIEKSVIGICSSIETLTYDISQKLAEWHINFLNIPDNLFIDKSTLK